MTKDQFVIKANQVHNIVLGYIKYGYDKSIVDGLRSKIIITCFDHEEPFDFEQTADNHLRKHGCPKCLGKQRMSQEVFLKKAFEIHGELYGYDRSVYAGIKSELDIFCNKLDHGYFKQKPGEHLAGNGCQKCGGNYRPTTEEFKIKAKEVHGDKFNYDEFIYSGHRDKSKIVCDKGHIFYQCPEHHLNGHGCSKCSNRHSEPEEKWLNRLNVKIENRQISLPNLPKAFKVDGYDPETNTVYEFHGDFWHGNPNNPKFKPEAINTVNKKTFKELYEKTIKRENKIKAAGYNLVVMWEMDFKTNDI